MEELRLQLTVDQPDVCLLWHDSFLPPGKVEEACVRVRFAQDGQVFISTGTPVCKSLGRHKDLSHESGGAAYSYLAYPIKGETAYPERAPLGERFVLTLRCDVAAREVVVAINDGSEVRAPLTDIFGLCYFGLALMAGKSLLWE